MSCCCCRCCCCCCCCSLQVPAEDPNYDVITERPWSQQTPAKGSDSSVWSRWLLPWRRSTSTSLLPLCTKEEERQPLLQQQPLESCGVCTDKKVVDVCCPAPGPVKIPGASRGAATTTAAAAAAAAKLAVYETLLSFGTPPCAHQSGEGGLRCSCKEQQQQQQSRGGAPPLFPVSVSLGFRTRGRIDFENVTVAYR